jgi:hypothetical protein
LDEPSFAQRLGQAAQERYQAELTPQVMAHKLESLYRQLAGRTVAASTEATDVRRAA